MIMKVQMILNGMRLAEVKFYKEQTGCGLQKARDVIWSAYETKEPVYIELDKTLEQLEYISKHIQELDLKPFIREERFKNLLDNDS